MEFHVTSIIALKKAYLEIIAMPMVQGSLYISEEQILWFSFPIMISRHQCIWILSCFVFVGGFTLLHLDFDLILFWVAVQLIIRKLKKSVCSQAESRPLKASTQRSTSSFVLLSFVMQLQHLDVKSGERICLWECLFLSFYNCLEGVSRERCFACLRNLSSNFDDRKPF